MIAAVASLLIAACAGGDEAAAAADPPPTVVAARTEMVQTQPFTEVVHAIGTVEARAGHLAALGAPAAGRVARVLVTPGQRVTAGQSLIVLDATTFAADARSAAADVEVARQNADRTARLLREGIAPRRDAEQAVAELARARAALIAARQQERLATIRAPIAGVVTRVSTALGATVDPSQSVVEIADPSALDVVFNVTPTDAARIFPGATVMMRAARPDDGAAPVTTVITDVGVAVDPASRGVAVRVRLPVRPGAPLIGQTVSGQIAVATRASAVVVPLEALVPEGDGFRVFVVDEDGMAHARPVVVGARADSLAEITSGLTAGTRIVTYGAYGMTDSAHVGVAARPASASAPLAHVVRRPAEKP